MKESNSSGKWVALITGAFSILIGFLYLLLITILDSRGPMMPPPPEAFGAAVIELSLCSAVVQLLF